MVWCITAEVRVRPSQLNVGGHPGGYATPPYPFPVQQIPMNSVTGRILDPESRRERQVQEPEPAICCCGAGAGNTLFVSVICLSVMLFIVLSPLLHYLAST